MDLSQYIGLFVDEAKQHLDQCSGTLLQLEQQPGKAALLNEVFRLIHTIKGMAATLVEFPYFQDITDLSHETEDLLDKLKSQNAIVDSQIIDLLFALTDALTILVNNVADPDHSHPIDFDYLYAHISKIKLSSDRPSQAQPQAVEILSGLQSWEDKYTQLESEKIARAAQEGKNCFEVSVDLQPGCQMKAIRALLVLRNLEEIADIIKTFPEQSAIQKGEFSFNFEIALVSDLDKEGIEERILSLAEIDKVKTFDLLGETNQDLRAVEHYQEDLEFTLPQLNEFEAKLIREAHKQALNTILLGVRLFPQTLLKSTRVAVIFRALEALGEIIKTVPTVMELEEEKFGNFFEVILITPESPEVIEKTLLSIAEVKDSIDVLTLMVDEQDTQIYTLDEAGESIRLGQSQHAIRLEGEASEFDKLLQNQKKSNMVRVDASKLDQLNNLIGDLVVNRSKLLHLLQNQASSELQDALRQLSSITTALQSMSVQLRMVPVEYLFGRFPRVVRDLAKTLGKEIEVVILGLETELERSLMDELSPLMIHMIRNAADHGLESPARRKELGKPAKGTITLNASYHQNWVALQISDDGQGINIHKLKEKAVEKNIISPQMAATMKSHEIHDLIFQAGLSTHDKATDISGRGVGMDAVRTQIEAMGGRVEVVSNQGEGTQFTIRFPHNLKIIKALLFSVNQDLYAIPLDKILHITELSSQEIKQTASLTQVAFQNQDIPLIDLRERLIPLDVQSCEINHASATPLIIVKNEQHICGLRIDELVGQEDLVLRMQYKQDAIAGSAVLYNDKVALVLDVDALVHVGG